jgi:hypothetical protein
MLYLQTKLDAAIAIAATGKNVVIVRCGTRSAEQAIRNESHHLIEKCTLLLPVDHNS